MYLQAKEDDLEKGLPIPDIVTVKEDCLRRRSESLLIGIPINDFVHFYIAIAKGKLDDKPTINSVNNLHRLVLRWLSLGYRDSNCFRG